MAADIKLAVDKVFVSAQWHVHGNGNITSIILYGNVWIR
jgi:hypothetical protein